MDGFVDDTTAWRIQCCAEALNPADDFPGAFIEKLQAMPNGGKQQALLHATGEKLESWKASRAYHSHHSPFLPCEVTLPQKYFTLSS
jgi:hypothetical protein